MNVKKKIDPLTVELALFAFPMLVGNILQSCYGMADMIIVGRFVGRDALAAISNTAMISFISGAVCIGFTIGGNVLVARYRGAGDLKGQRETIGTLFAVSAIGGMLLTVLNYLLYWPLLQLMNIPAEAVPYAVEYMNIVCAGNFFVFGYNAVCAVLRGLGDSKRPLYFVAVTAVVNILLDCVFVGVLRWGVGGAALATVLAQAASFFAAVLSLKWQGDKNPDFVFHFKRGALRIYSEKCVLLLRLGFPTALRSAALNITYLVVTAMFNEYGTAQAAAAGIGLKVNTFVAMPCWAAGQAVTTMTGHYLGAGIAEKARSVTWKGIKLSLVFTGTLLIFMQLFAEPFMKIFSTDPEVVALGVLYLRICCSLNFVPYAAMYIFDSFATGAGAVNFAMVNSFLHSVIFRLGLSILLAKMLGLGFIGLCIAESVCPLVPSLTALVFFFRYQKQGEAVDRSVIR